MIRRRSFEPAPGRRLASAMGVALLGLGCQGNVNTAAPSTGETVSFSEQIQPIFNRHCIGCHSEGTLGNTLGTPLDLSAGGAHDMLIDRPSEENSRWTLVVPGDSASSLLYLKVSRSDPPVGSTMPLFGAPLSGTALGLIRDWIDQGAEEN